jgi:hypothetical protein
LHSHGSAVLATVFIFPEPNPSLLQSLHDTKTCHVVIYGVMTLNTSRVVGLKPGYWAVGLVGTAHLWLSTALNQIVIEPSLEGPLQDDLILEGFWRCCWKMLNFYRGSRHGK